MPTASPLKQLARSATEQTDPSPLLPRLTNLLFPDAALGFWHGLKPPMDGLLQEDLAQRQLKGLSKALTAIGDHLRRADGLGEAEQTAMLLRVLDILEANRALFFLADATAEERLTRLPLFTPMAVLHLSILGILHNRDRPHSGPSAPPLRDLGTTANHYHTFARQSVADALAWRTNRLQITFTPMRSAIPGGPNLMVSCVDAHTGHTIVDQICPAYPGTPNPQLQRTVNQISLYEEQLHWKIVFFWEHEVLDVISEWSKEKEKGKRPAPPDNISRHLEEALFLIMQDLGGALSGRS